MTMSAMDRMEMASTRATTISVRDTTRAHLEALKSGGQSYDDVIQELLKLAEHDPWIEEMGNRIEEVRTGRARTGPIEDLRKADRASRRGQP